MAQAMKTRVTEELWSKNKADHLPPKAPATEQSFELPSHPKNQGEIPILEEAKSWLKQNPAKSWLKQS